MSQVHHKASSRLRTLPLMVLMLIVGVILGVTVSRTRGTSIISTAPVVSKSAPEALPEPPSIAAKSAFNPSIPHANSTDATNMTNGARNDIDQEAQSQLDAYTRRYSGEQVDARWAGTTEAKLLTASKSEQITQLQAEPLALDVDCKATMCRIQADFRNRSSADDWFTLFSMNGSDIPTTFYKYSVNADGSARMTIYGLVRD